MPVLTGPAVVSENTRIRLQFRHTEKCFLRIVNECSSDKNISLWQVSRRQLSSWGEKRWYCHSLDVKHLVSGRCAQVAPQPREKQSSIVSFCQNWLWSIFGSVDRGKEGGCGLKFTARSFWGSWQIETWLDRYSKFSTVTWKLRAVIKAPGKLLFCRPRFHHACFNAQQF